MEYGAPQGSVLGPKFFNAYVRSQPSVFESCDFKSSAFADDSNGMKTFALTFQYNVLKNDVPNCVNKIVEWMNEKFLKINPDKTELVLFHPESQRDNVIIRGTTIGGQCIRFSKKTKNVGVWLDENLNFDTHINHTVSHCYKLLKDIGSLRNVLTNNLTEQLVHAVICSRLDYCNSLLFNVNKSNIFKLQKVQNAAARLEARCGKRHSVSNVISNLHWLRIEARIVFKILLLVHKCIVGKCSNNLSITYKAYNRRPDDYLMLQQNKVNTNYGKRTFDYASSRLWNVVPMHLRSTENTDSFKKGIKTMLFADFNNFMKRVNKYN